MRLNDLLGNLYLTLLLITLVNMGSEGQNLSQNEPIRFLALGDSYTIGERVAEVQRWPMQLLKGLQLRGYTCLKPEIVAVTGWRTDELMKSLQARPLAKEYSLVSLLIGVNNQYQGRNKEEYQTEFKSLLQSAIGYAGGDKRRVFVLSIPDYGFTPFGRKNQSEISREIDAFNEINEAIAKKNKVTYINITDISRRGLSDPELVAEDGLHPSGEMYKLWVERILEFID